MKRETILCIEEETMLKELPGVGFIPSVEYKPEAILSSFSMWFAPRDVVESRESFKQLIPYVVLVCNDLVGLYRRTPKGGEGRLHNRYSIGFGGHVSVSDIVTDGETIDVEGTLELAARRELEEEVNHSTVLSKSLLGVIYDDTDAVSRVHLGLVQLWRVEEPTLSAAEAAIDECEFVPVSKLAEVKENLEGWSSLVADYLSSTNDWISTS